ncbi:hypothetical protein [uncultured Methanobrevibacter sp.]|uniref:hypothetical protein n=1 Tax=uncultured Methanobrevibacter sp. TaxID=253161 RepID=UPI0025CD3DDC|nr:hypothetical protein [uncultured Methanobrevibacter sp.]
MKHVQSIDNFTNESLKSLFYSTMQYNPRNPNHRNLYNSFISWFKRMLNEYPEDLILNTLMSAEEDIQLGQI